MTIFQIYIFEKLHIEGTWHQYDLRSFSKRIMKANLLFAANLPFVCVLTASVKGKLDDVSVFRQIGPKYSYRSLTMTDNPCLLTFIAPIINHDNLM